ncbi:MAG: hypothetical protein L3K13_02860 [Thermoplasmata archaeon]|nr:hypothetical protein [Thermoplasmata archaeon]
MVTSHACPGGATNRSFPVDSTVSFRWSITSGPAPVKLTVYDALGSEVYQGSGSGGAGLFDSRVGPYEFNITTCNPVTVDVTGGYLLGGGL